MTSVLSICFAGYSFDGHLTLKLGRPPLETLIEGRSEKWSECGAKHGSHVFIARG